MKKEDKEVLNFATQAVQFETGKTSLLKKSYPVLDQVFDVLTKYPNYSCSINGHTDNVGNSKNNQKLSEGRAKVCMDYLVKKGIAASRLTSAGFGDSQPVGDNKTAAGRAKNRRTEFNVFLK
jgi:outer membrane protein OmpA-like peptidoglycan-associated protein